MFKNLFNSLIVKGYSLYCRVKSWLTEQEFRRKHFTVSLDRNGLGIEVVEHESQINKLENQLREYQKHYKARAFIKKGLELATKGCNFIIFQEKGDENKFIQFWTSNGKIVHDFPMPKSSGFRPHRLVITGLLANLGFIKKSTLGIVDRNFWKYKYCFWLEKVDHDLWIVKANFEKNHELCSKYTYLALKKVLRVVPENITIKLG